MGVYIDPTDGSDKLDWLLENGSPVTLDFVRSFEYSKETLPVCLVDNGPFMAAGVGFNREESSRFMGNDGRPKRWFLVNKEVMLPHVGTAYRSVVLNGRME